MHKTKHCKLYMSKNGLTVRFISDFLISIKFYLTKLGKIMHEGGYILNCGGRGCPVRGVTFSVVFLKVM